MTAETVYDTAFGLKDGPVYAAVPVRKSRRTKSPPSSLRILRDRYSLAVRSDSSRHLRQER
jgi:hypothetical protein